ncbi:hypothetical protein ACFL6S_37415, partial [Candidatus Poribacteria bacterium]
FFLSFSSLHFFSFSFSFHMYPFTSRAKRCRAGWDKALPAKTEARNLKTEKPSNSKGLAVIRRIFAPCFENRRRTLEIEYSGTCHWHDDGARLIL